MHVSRGARGKETRIKVMVLVKANRDSEAGTMSGEHLLRAMAAFNGHLTWPQSAHLRDDLGLDSFAALELLFELEDRLGVRIAKAAAPSFQTVGGVVTYLMAERAAPKPAQPSAGEPVAS